MHYYIISKQLMKSIMIKVCGHQLQILIHHQSSNVMSVILNTFLRISDETIHSIFSITNIYSAIFFFMFASFFFLPSLEISEIGSKKFQTWDLCCLWIKHNIHLILVSHLPPQNCLFMHLSQ